MAEKRFNVKRLVQVSNPTKIKDTTVNLKCDEWKLVAENLDKNHAHILCEAIARSIDNFGGMWQQDGKIWFRNNKPVIKIEEVITYEVPWHKQALDVTGDGARQRDYGHPLPNFLRIAIPATTYLEKKLRIGQVITPIDIAFLNDIQKTARQQNMHKADNFVDKHGYMMTVWRMHERMQQIGYADGVEAFDDMGIGEMYTILTEKV